MTHVRGYLDPDYLQHVAATVGRHKRRTYDLMHLTAGHHTLDLGCGPRHRHPPACTLTGVFSASSTK